MAQQQGSVSDHDLAPKMQHEASLLCVRALLTQGKDEQATQLALQVGMQACHCWLNAVTQSYLPTLHLNYYDHQQHQHALGKAGQHLLQESCSLLWLGHRQKWSSTIPQCNACTYHVNSHLACCTGSATGRQLTDCRACQAASIPGDNFQLSCSAACHRGL